MASRAFTDVWVVGDCRSRRLFDMSLYVLGKARDVSQVLEGQTAMILLDDPCSWPGLQEGAPKPIPLESAILESQHRGAETVYVLECPGQDGAGRALVSALADLVDLRVPGLVLFPLTDWGRDVAAMTACLCNAGVIADCAALKVQGDRIIGSCPAWGGQIMAEIAFSRRDHTGFATVQTRAEAPNPLPNQPEGGVFRVGVQAEEGRKIPRLLSRTEEISQGQDLEQADIVVVGGAGLGDTLGFGLVRELAAVMGGALGATRPPVLQRWVNEECLIGQTGKTVRPRLLLSIGTSGATQYTAGILESGTLVAINRDRKAPIFQVADVGLVMDAKAFLPVLIEKIKQVRMRLLADVLTLEKSGQESGEFGERVRRLREAQGWSLERLAEATSQSPEFIAQVEKGTLTPPVSFLVGLARAMGMVPGAFLYKEEEKAILDQRSRAFVKRTRNYSYQTLTPDARHRHLQGFMVTIESHHAHKPVEYKHEGEEFIYVMEGDLEFTLGGKVHVLQQGESIHFNSDIPHKLKSLSNKPTRCLVILYTG